jgi:hypothetical protein
VRVLLAGTFAFMPSCFAKFTMKNIFLTALLLISSGMTHAGLLDEIQVYTDDINTPGEWGLELHINSTPRGVSKPTYAGEIMNNHGIRFTPEISYGITKTIEAGLYIPMVRGSDGNLYSAGSKLRLKWLPIQASEDGGVFGGVNLELSQVKPQFSQSAQSLEIRNIIGWKNSQWLIAANPIFGWDLSPGFTHHSPEFNLGLKISRVFSESVALGLEYYNGRGRLNNTLTSSMQDKTVFLALDYEGRPFNFNFGVGKGINSASDTWTIKGIVDVPF